MKNFQVIRSLHSEHGIEESNEIDCIIDEIFTNFENDTNIDNLIVMAIDYQGKHEDLPNVFVNMNTGGISLSKYEIYAALWASWSYKIKDEDIISGVISKYEAIENSSELDVDYNDDDIRNDGITLFEYCYALSGLLREKYEQIFGKPSKGTDPLGFELLTLILGYDVNKAEKLGDILRHSTEEFLVELKNIIFASCTVISNALNNTVKGINETNLCSDSNYLIYHIVVSYIKEYYYVNVNENKITSIKSELKKQDFIKNLPYHYVYDNITDYWKQHRQVSELTKDLNETKKANKYWFAITPDKWIDGIDYFINSQDSGSNKISYNNKLFLDFYLRKKIDSNPSLKKYTTKVILAKEKNIKIDIEHIVPQNIIKSHIKDLSAVKQKIFPTSHIGNICYLARLDNRSKKQKTIYEYKEGRPSFICNDDYLNFINYPKQSKLEFLNYDNENFRDHYDKFIKERSFELKDEMMNLLLNTSK